MNQKTIIIIASLILIGLLAILGYLMFFTSPENPEGVFANLGENGEVIPSNLNEEPVVVNEEPVVNLERPKLLQLTTRPVIGFTEITNNDGSLAIYYAEAGTGHIYSINLSSGEEVRISNTTIPEAAKASFSGNGKYVALKANNNVRSGEIIIGTINKTEGNLSLNTIDASVYDFTINQTDLLYTVRETSGLVAKAYNLKSGVMKNLFTVPFFEANIAWGSTTEATHFAFPKPASLLEGYLYSFTKGKMKRLPVSGFGFTGFNTNSHVFYSKLVDYKPLSFVYDKSSGTEISSPILLLPEKCTMSHTNSSYSWCAGEIRDLPLEFPDDWYRGTLSFKDSLWQISTEDYSFSELVNTYTESGREIDIMGLNLGESESALYFVNKNDNALWMYEL